MKETGLMFKAPLVRAILSGQKTQTRRVIKPQPPEDRLHCSVDSPDAFVASGEWTWWAGNLTQGIYHTAKFPLGKPGDRIYVRETFVQGYEEDPLTGRLKQWDEEGNDIPMTTWYRATNGGITWSDDGESEVNVPWKPAIHMPKSLARIWLEVTGVRVERLQSISRGDAMAEGCPFPNMADGADPRDWFAEVWKSTGGDWAANPWVWVIDFKRIEKPQ
ncbi:hypothetical protein [Comamonas testosteroni]|uniref:hypothetical protein n=1 Tax=Comamonas testosteroni TaxID=285 RepID=UPI0005B4F053|nr:hypothetical protein [Comamonas testosteroni]